MGLTFSAPQLSAAITTRDQPYTFSTSYAFNPTATNNFGIYATVNYLPQSDGPQYQVTPVVTVPGGGVHTCNLFPLHTNLGSINCPDLLVTSFGPGTATIAFTSNSANQGGYAFSIATVTGVDTTTATTTATVTDPGLPMSTVTTSSSLPASTQTNTVTTTLTGVSTVTTEGVCPSSSATLLSSSSSSAAERSTTSVVTPLVPSTSVDTSSTSVATSSPSVATSSTSASVSSSTITAAPNPPTTLTTKTTSTTAKLVCHADNCLRNLQMNQPVAQGFCNTYTMGTQTSLGPSYVPANCSPSRLSSACTCLAQTPLTSTSLSTSVKPITSSAPVTTSKTTSIATSSSKLVCNADNCLRALQISMSAAAPFCSTYTMGGVTSTPAFIPATCTPSRLSSACSCIATTAAPSATRLAKRDEGFAGPDFTLSNGGGATVTITSTVTTSVAGTTTSTVNVVDTITVTATSTIDDTTASTVTTLPASCASDTATAP